MNDGRHEMLQAGSLRIIGIGPGPADWITPEASRILAGATALVGYRAYLAQCPQQSGQTRHGSDNGVELERARDALRLAQNGKRVAVVSGGDPGVFAMAAAVFEAVDHGDPAWRDIDIQVLPGISAMQAAAARLGAPLGHDFCAISLSDNLKPWALVEKRLTAAADGDFVMALYNPASKARRDQIRAAFALLRRHKTGATPVMFAKSVGRADEHIIVATLKDADPEVADMATLIIIGSSETKLIFRDGRQPYVYTPRGARRAP
jgi:precorrin-3B C17-methyltransferase